LLFATGRVGEAVDEYRRVTELAPGSAAGYNNLGAALQMAGRLDDAAEAFERSLEIEPAGSAYSNLGTVHYFLGRFSEAAENYAAATRLTNENQQYWGNLGDALAQIPDRRAEAGPVYRQALRLAQRDLAASPGDAVVTAQVAYYHDRLGEPAAAQPFLDAALASARGSPYVWYYAAAAMQLRGRTAEAQSYVQNAIAAGYPRKLIDADPLLGRISPTAQARHAPLSGAESEPTAGAPREESP
jgi:tetratricopeptide (TPR) repeat protein